MPKVIVRKDFLCPIDHKLMKYPVSLINGKIYEQKNIEWDFQRTGFDPITNKRLSSMEMKLDTHLKTKIEEFVEKNQICSESVFFEMLLEGKVEELSELNYPDCYFNYRNEDSLTILHQVVKKGVLKSFIWLLKEGADIYAKTNRKDSVFHLAALAGHIDIMAYLLEVGMNVHILNEEHLTPLHFAVSSGRVDVMAWLIERGGNIRIKDGHQNTLLHSASGGGHIEIANMLIELGINVNAVNKYHYTPLHYAVLNNHVSMAKLLIDKGAEVDAWTKEGRSPLNFAESLGYQRMVAFLIRHGAIHNALSLDELKSVLEMAVTARLSVFDKKELKFLATILKRNKTLTRLDLEIEELQECEIRLLFKALHNNSTLTDLNVQGFYSDYSEIFQNHLKRKRSLALLRPYKFYFSQIGFSINRFFSSNTSNAYSMDEAIFELVHLFILTLPLDKFSSDFKKGCYEWIIYLLANEPRSSAYDFLIKLAFSVLLEEERKIRGLPGQQFDLILKRYDLLVWSGENFVNLYSQLYQCYPGCFNPIVLPLCEKNYREGVRCIADFLRRQDIDLSGAKEILGEERCHLLLHFTPLYKNLKKVNAQQVFVTIKKYQELLALKTMMEVLKESDFKGVYQHFCVKYPDLFSKQSLEELSESCWIIKQSDLFLYKVAAVLANQNYWTSVEMEQWEHRCITALTKMYKEFGPESNVVECLIEQKKLFKEKWKTKVFVFDINNSVHHGREYLQLCKLFRCLANMNELNPDLKEIQGVFQKLRETTESDSVQQKEVTFLSVAN